MYLYSVHCTVHRVKASNNFFRMGFEKKTY
jgi:hypothetical protein